MSNWVGTWDVEQATIVGTLLMDMIVRGSDGDYDVAFESPQVVATVSDVVVDGDRLTLTTQLTKPMKARAEMDLTLTGPDSFTGTGKIKFLPSSKFKGIRRADSAY